MTSKFLFPTQNKNLSALSVPWNVQSLLSSLQRASQLHSLAIEDLSEEAESGVSGATFTGTPGDDVVQGLLFNEVFGS